MNLDKISEDFSMKKLFYVKDYSKSGVSDSEAIRLCLDEANREAEKTVVFDGKDYLLDEAIVLTSGTHVIIDNCTLKQSDKVFDNIFRGANVIVNPDAPYDYPLDVKTIENIKIEGKGNAKLIGTDVPRIGYHPGQNEYQKMIGDFWGWRTMMISFAKADSIEISGLELSQTMCWAITFEWSTNIYIHDISIYADTKNGDGIDFRSGCHHCKVENISGYTTDDTVACTALSKGTRYAYPNAKSVYPMTVAAGCVDGYNHDIHDIEIRGIKTGGLHHGVICLAANGDKVYNITIEDVEESGEGARMAAVTIYTGYGDGYTPGDIHNITVNGVHAKSSRFGLEVRADIRAVHLQNIVQDNPNGEQLAIYPSFGRKGNYSRGMSTCGNSLEEITDELFDSYRRGFIFHAELSLPESDVAKVDFAEFKKLIHKNGITLSSLHLPFSPFDKVDISNPAIADASVELMSDIIRRAMSARMYLFKTFVIHASGEPIADGERKERMECAKRSLKKLAEVAAECGAVIAVENLPRTCLGRDSAEILELISAHPMLKVCFDTNHLLTESHEDFIRAVGKKIVTTHISDYDFVDERHLMPGEGKIDWYKLVETLVEVGCPCSWTYEVPAGKTKNIERSRKLTPFDFEKNAVSIFEGKEPITVK